MGIIVNWDDKNQRVIRYQLEGDWDWADFDDAVLEAIQFSEHLSHRIDVIFDLTESNDIPDGVVLYFKKLLKTVPNNRRHFVVIGTNPQISVIVTMFNRVFKSISGRISHTDTLERARSYIAYLQAEDLRLAV